MNSLVRLFRAGALKRQIAGLASGRQMLEEKLEELRALTEKIQGEPLPEPEGLSLDSRRLINTAVIALAQHLVVHFSEHDLASLAKTSTERAVADMKFGDRRDCDRMVERIREKIEELKQQKTFADQVKRRTDLLLAEVKYRNETDSVPSVECAADRSAARRARKSTSSRWRAARATRRCASTSSPTTTGTCWPSCAERYGAGLCSAISATIRAACRSRIASDVAASSSCSMVVSGCEAERRTPRVLARQPAFLEALVLGDPPVEIQRDALLRRDFLDGRDVAQAGS